MSEWFKVHPWKGCIGAILSGVRIPIFPLAQMLCTLVLENPARSGTKQRYLVSGGDRDYLSFFFFRTACFPCL